MAAAAFTSKVKYAITPAFSPDEKIVYSWVEWPSKEVRDEGWKKMMEDQRMKDQKMPFDGKRMIYGGFAPIVEA